MKFISNKLIAFTFFGLLVYLTIDFFQKKEEELWQFNYNWKEVKTIEKLGKVEIDSVTRNYLEISTDKDIPFIKGNTLELYLKDRKYYFNFENSSQKEKKIIFRGGFWVVYQPVSSYAKASAKLIDLPIKQEGDIKVNLITDSQLLWRGGKNFRKWFSDKQNDFYFVGEKRDVYGFPFNGGINYNSEKVLKNINKIPKADIYIVCLGTYERRTNIGKTIANFQQIIKELLEKNSTSKIYLINLPPSSDLERNEYNLELNQYLSNLASSQVHYIDFYKILKNKKEELIIKDKIHYKGEAYKLLINCLNQQINESK